MIKKKNTQQQQQQQQQQQRKKEEDKNKYSNGLNLSYFLWKLNSKKYESSPISRALARGTLFHDIFRQLFYRNIKSFSQLTLQEKQNIQSLDQHDRKTIFCAISFLLILSSKGYKIYEVEVDIPNDEKVLSEINVKPTAKNEGNKKTKRPDIVFINHERSEIIVGDWKTGHSIGDQEIYSLAFYEHHFKKLGYKTKSFFIFCDHDIVIPGGYSWAKINTQKGGNLIEFSMCDIFNDSNEFLCSGFGQLKQKKQEQEDKNGDEDEEEEEQEKKDESDHYYNNDDDLKELQKSRKQEREEREQEEEEEDEDEDERSRRRREQIASITAITTTTTPTRNPVSHTQKRMTTRSGKTAADELIFDNPQNKVIVKPSSAKGFDPLFMDRFGNLSTFANFYNFSVEQVNERYDYIRRSVSGLTDFWVAVYNYVTKPEIQNKIWKKTSSIIKFKFDEPNYIAHLPNPRDYVSFRETEIIRWAQIFDIIRAALIDSRMTPDNQRERISHLKVDGKSNYKKIIRLISVLSVVIWVFGDFYQNSQNNLANADLLTYLLIDKIE